MNVVQENKYARITGAVRSMKGKRHVIAFNISAIKDLNEVTMHIAEVIHSSMAVEAMDKQVCLFLFAVVRHNIILFFFKIILF